MKIISFILAALLACATQKRGADAKPGDLFTQLGIYTLFVTGSNDLAMGLAIIESLYPSATTVIDLNALTFVVVGMQVAIFNPASFVLLELGKAKAGAAKEGSRSSKCAIAKVVTLNLLRSPVIVATFVGLLYNAVNPPVPGDTTVFKNIPYLLDAMILKGGSAFGMGKGGGLIPVTCKHDLERVVGCNDGRCALSSTHVAPSSRTHVYILSNIHTHI